MIKKPRDYAVILSGGEGTRLYSLTARRAKPAVPIMGQYRMIDFPMSNCKKSNIDFIDILVQYQPDSLQRHLNAGTPWGYSSMNLNIYGMKQTREDGVVTFGGTADAVHANMHRIQDKDPAIVLILSGDHVYDQNYRDSIDEHIARGSNLTIYTQVKPLTEARNFGVLRVNSAGRIIDFEEKPQEPARIQDFKLDSKAKERLGIKEQKDICLVSMGIYIFSPQRLYEQLGVGGLDFGKHIIPRMVADKKEEVHAYVFNGYWEDVGRLDKLIDANFYSINHPDEVFSPYLITNMRNLPGAVVKGELRNSIISPGCVIEEGAIVEGSILGYQTIVRTGATVKNCIIHGGDRHETDASGDIIKHHRHYQSIIGRDAFLQYVLLDRNIHVEDAKEGKNVRLIGKQNPEKIEKALESIGLERNNEEHPYGLFNITDTGFIVVGKPLYNKELLFKAGFQL